MGLYLAVYITLRGAHIVGRNFNYSPSNSTHTTSTVYKVCICDGNNPSPTHTAFLFQSSIIKSPTPSQPFDSICSTLHFCQYIHFYMKSVLLSGLNGLSNVLGRIVIPPAATTTRTEIPASQPTHHVTLNGRIQLNRIALDDKRR